MRMNMMEDGEKIAKQDVLGMSGRLYSYENTDCEKSERYILIYS